MSIERSRTAWPVVDQPRGLTMGSWSMWLTLTALTTGLAGIVAAALYLHSGQPAWPPAPLRRPGGGYALLLLASAGAGAAVLDRAKRQLRRAEHQRATLSLLVSGALLTAAPLLAGLDLARAGFRHDAHAYASVYWVNTILAAVLVGVAVVMVAAVTIQRLIGVVDEARMLELEVAAGYAWWSVPAAAALLAAAHLLPDPGGAATAGAPTVVGTVAAAALTALGGGA